MRAAYHLAFAVFCLGTIAMPTTTPNATYQAEPFTSVNQQYAFLDAAHNIASDVSVGGTGQGTNLASHFSRGAIIGETLSEDIELHLIPRHETYRYAVVNNHRIIVDATSRRVVYVVR